MEKIPTTKDKTKQKMDIVFIIKNHYFEKCFKRVNFEKCFKHVNFENCIKRVNFVKCLTSNLNF